MFHYARGTESRGILVEKSFHRLLYLTPDPALTEIYGIFCVLLYFWWLAVPRRPVSWLDKEAEGGCDLVPYERAAVVSQVAENHHSFKLMGLVIMMETLSNNSNPPLLDDVERPEIEEGLGSSQYLGYRDSLIHVKTTIDVLEIDGPSADDCDWNQNLDYEAIHQHFGNQIDQQRSTAPRLRVVFLNPLDINPDERTVAASPQTLEWLCFHFGISVLFLDAIVRGPRGIKPGNACFTQRDKRDKIARVDAMYHMRGEIEPCCVWFTHDCTVESTTYVVFNCPSKARNVILTHALGRHPQKLLGFGAIDATIANAGDSDLKDEAMHWRIVLLDYEKARDSNVYTTQYYNTFQKLHDLSQAIHVLQENLMDQYEVIAFVLDLQQRYATALQTPHRSAGESLEYLLTRNHRWRRWVLSYSTRVENRIDLAFNVASQHDNTTNTKIANASAEIARESRKDSSSMITLAALTMLFPPGTFVSVSN